MIQTAQTDSAPKAYRGLAHPLEARPRLGWLRGKAWRIAQITSRPNSTGAQRRRMRSTR